MRKFGSWLLVAGLSLVGPLTAYSTPSHIGQPALEIQAGEWYNTRPLSLRSLQGKVVVVEFWATWCGPCLRSIPHLKELHSRYADKGVVLISLSSENADDVAPFVKEKGMSYAVGAESETSDRYGVTGIPHAFVIDRQGKICWEGHPLNGLDQAIESALK